MSHKQLVKYLLSSLTLVASMIATLVYLTWFAASIEKRVTLLEQHDVSSQDNFDDVEKSLKETNANQDQNFHQFQATLDTKIERLDDKIDNLLFILLRKKP